MCSSPRSRRRSASRYLPRARVQDSLLQFVRYSTKDIIGSFHSTWRKRTWIFKPSLVVSGCEIGWWQTSLSSLTPASCLSKTRHNRDVFPANTMAYDSQGKRHCWIRWYLLNLNWFCIWVDILQIFVSGCYDLCWSFSDHLYMSNSLSMNLQFS